MLCSLLPGPFLCLAGPPSRSHRPPVPAHWPGPAKTLPSPVGSHSPWASPSDTYISCNFAVILWLFEQCLPHWSDCRLQEGRTVCFPHHCHPSQHPSQAPVQAPARGEWTNPVLGGPSHVLQTPCVNPAVITPPSLCPLFTRLSSPGSGDHVWTNFVSLVTAHRKCVRSVWASAVCG